jgi:hypothetical protein
MSNDHFGRRSGRPYVFARNQTEVRFWPLCAGPVEAGLQRIVAPLPNVPDERALVVGVFVRSMHNLARTALEAACSKASRPYRLSQLDGISTH